MINPKENVLTKIRKVKFEKKDKKSAIILDSSIKNFKGTVKSEIKTLSSNMSAFEAKNTVIDALNTRMAEIVNMRNKHVCYSKRDQGKNYLTNIVLAIKDEILELYQGIEVE